MWSLEVRQVDLRTELPTPGAQYALPPGDHGDLAHAGPMVVLPDIVHAHDGRVYATSGQIVDVSNPDSPTPEGTFNYQGAVLPQPALGRVLMLTPVGFGGDPATLRQLAPRTFTQVAEVTMPGIEASVLFDFTTADGSTLAVLGRQGFDSPTQVYLFEVPFGG